LKNEQAPNCLDSRYCGLISIRSNPLHEPDYAKKNEMSLLDDGIDRYLRISQCLQRGEVNQSDYEANAEFDDEIESVTQELHAVRMTVVWPERDATTSNQQGKDIPDEPTAAFGARSRTVHRDPSS
jgi:hypothetical protein